MVTIVDIADAVAATLNAPGEPGFSQSLDGAIDEAGNQGLASNCSVTSFTRNEPLEEAVTVSVTLKPSSFTDWYVVPGS